jgi:hypothetical protein
LFFPPTRRRYCISTVFLHELGGEAWNKNSNSNSRTLSYGPSKWPHSDRHNSTDLLLQPHGDTNFWLYNNGTWRFIF